jgi:hypothetical protein
VDRPSFGISALLRDLQVVESYAAYGVMLAGDHRRGAATGSFGTAKKTPAVQFREG